MKLPLKYSFVIFILFVQMNVFGQKRIVDRDFEKHLEIELNNNLGVDSVHVYKSLTNGSSLSAKALERVLKRRANLLEHLQFTFNKKGQIVSAKNYTQNARLGNRYNFSYQSENDYVVRKIDINDNVRFVWEYKNGQLDVAYSQKASGKLKYKWDWIYFNDTLLSNVVKTDGDNNIVLKEERIFNEKNERIVYKVYEGNELAYFQTFAFTDDDKPLNTVLYDADSLELIKNEIVSDTIKKNDVVLHTERKLKKNRTSTYTYNTDGKLKEHVIKDNAGNQISKEVYMYNENGKISAELSYEDNRLKYRHLYYYDKYGVARRELFKVKENKEKLIFVYLQERNSESNVTLKIFANRGFDIGTTIVKYQYY